MCGIFLMLQSMVDVFLRMRASRTCDGLKFPNRPTFTAQIEFLRRNVSNYVKYKSD